ncbi:uncharacterized protein LOC110034220, partial [Phalaenopsis equestris]|uniref:uncharacterized protein LOC110034220 n=1 Tax=Phalaenopsis equestris TaxID=78828 RepID=UPI0009E47B93
KHLRRLQRNLGTSCSTSDSSDDSTSTSDDASFEENIEPEFDVTKFMLWERYVKQSEQSVQKGNAEKNVEIEAVADEKRKIGIAMNKGGGSGKEIPVLGLGAISGDHRSTVVTGKTGREGPRFRDLGGM